MFSAVVRAVRAELPVSALVLLDIVGKNDGRTGTEVEVVRTVGFKTTEMLCRKTTCKRLSFDCETPRGFGFGRSHFMNDNSAASRPGNVLVKIRAIPDEVETQMSSIR
jgi:hypothetical protein